MLEQKGERLGY